MRRFTEQALSRPTEEFVRSHGLRLVVSAVAELESGNLDAACAAGTRAVEVAGRISSARTTEYVRDLLHRLEPHGDEPRVAELRERAARCWSPRPERDAHSAHRAGAGRSVRHALPISGLSRLSVGQCTIGVGGGVMMTHAAYDCDVLVIGGGIVGLSTAYALARAAPGTRVTVLEKERGPARHQTGRNSGVIHSGIYYRPGSLKARYAARLGGARGLLREHGIAHATTGKLIVATERSELPPAARPGAARPRARAARAGAGPGPDRGARAGGRGLAAIGSARRASATSPPWPTASPPRSGRRAASCGTARRSGAIDRRPWGVAVRTADGLVVRARVLVNCAGLHCDRVARLAGGRPGGADRAVPG